MNNKQFNERRYNRRRQYCRLALGFQQFINYPLLNLIWVLFVVGVFIFVRAGKRFIENIEVYPMFTGIFNACMMTILIIFPIICAIGIIQFIGFCFSIRDEADMEIVFSDKLDIFNQSPILMYKKKDRKSGVISREFYTIISMKYWQEKKEAICDRMDIHIIGDIAYGGRKKNKGYRIYFESAQGRKTIERGVLYDDSI